MRYRRITGLTGSSRSAARKAAKAPWLLPWVRSVFASANCAPTESGLSATASRDRKSTRLNSSHGYISYAVFCLKKKEPVRTAVRRLHVGRRRGHGLLDAVLLLYRRPGRRCRVCSGVVDLPPRAVRLVLACVPCV